MWIAAKVEPNRSGASKQVFRLYALAGQPLDVNMPIQCPVSERENGNYYIVEVGMTQGSQKASYPYLLRKHSQHLNAISRHKALTHVRKNSAAC